MWKLEFLENHQWVGITDAATGDNAKTKVRLHQIGRGQLERYRILGPDGKTWLYGKPVNTRRGLRMNWSSEYCG